MTRQRAIESGGIDAAVEECGNGFPDPGDYVSDGTDLYRVVRAGSRIETQSGRGNICVGYRLRSAEWTDLADDEEPHSALAILASDDEEAEVQP